MISITSNRPQPAPAEIERALSAAAIDERILQLWGQRFDTFEIGRAVGRPQSYVANRLARLRDQRAL